MYPKDTEKWKQFTTRDFSGRTIKRLFCIPKILKNESNSQQIALLYAYHQCCFVSQRYWKMKAIHNHLINRLVCFFVVLYPKDTEKWKQFTTGKGFKKIDLMLFCIPKILKNESNSQRKITNLKIPLCCFVSQRYWKMKAIHNSNTYVLFLLNVVLYPKDTEKWKQFTTRFTTWTIITELFCIPKILKNESNSQLKNNHR